MLTGKENAVIGERFEVVTDVSAGGGGPSLAIRDSRMKNRGRVANTLPMLVYRSFGVGLSERPELASWSRRSANAEPAND